MFENVKVFPALFRRIFVVLAFFFGAVQSHAQQHEQLWLDFQVDYPFANKYLLEVTPSYQTVLSQENKWRSIGLSTTFEYTLFTRIDLTAELPMAYTQQKEDVNSFELSPLLGSRIHITQNKRFNSRILLRYQQRYFRQVETEDWDVSNRVRLKGEIWITLNGPNLFTDKLWYIILDYEEFFVLDQQLEERYANRRRGRMGVGYRLNYKHRFDLIYTRQSSRDEIDGDFIRNDNIIQLRYKMFLNPAKVADNN